jgi:hypothetical protein
MSLPGRSWGIASGFDVSGDHVVDHEAEIRIALVRQ